MAKLSLQSIPGFNAGKNYFAKPVRISEIVIDPEISQIFKIHDKVLLEIQEKIMKFGYDKSQPVVVWKGQNILVDGHTRLAAAKEAGLDEIPTVEKEFESREAAVLYTFERQVLRRNLTGPEILKAAQMIPDGRNEYGKGRAAEQLAQRIGVSSTTIYQARAVLKEASEEDLQAIQDGDMSIKAAYNKVTAPKKTNKPDVEFSTTDACGLPENVKFLKGAVILLIEAEQKPAAELLINHYLKKNERNGFCKLLPESIQNGLAKLV